MLSGTLVWQAKEKKTNETNVTSFLEPISMLKQLRHF